MEVGGLVLGWGMCVCVCVKGLCRFYEFHMNAYVLAQLQCMAGRMLHFSIEILQSGKLTHRYLIELPEPSQGSRKNQAGTVHMLFICPMG